MMWLPLSSGPLINKIRCMWMQFILSSLRLEQPVISAMPRKNQERYAAAINQLFLTN